MERLLVLDLTLQWVRNTAVAKPSGSVHPCQWFVFARNTVTQLPSWTNSLKPNLAFRNPLSAGKTFRRKLAGKFRSHALRCSVTQLRSPKGESKRCFTNERDEFHDRGPSRQDQFHAQCLPIRKSFPLLRRRCPFRRRRVFGPVGPSICRRLALWGIAAAKHFFGCVRRNPKEKDFGVF